MAFLLIAFVLLSLVVPQQQMSNPDDSLVSVLSYNWSKTRRTVDNGSAEGAAPAREMISANRNFQRNVRANDPVGARDPNEDTLDGRRAAMEKSVQESRSPGKKLMDGFLYKTKVHNNSAKSIAVVFWEYQIMDPHNPSLITKRQFLCGVEIRPKKEKDLEGFSTSGPVEVVSVDNLATKDTKGLQEKVLINRVEYNDGSIWQRKDWNFQEIRLTYQRAVREPWAPGMCKSL